MALNEIITNTFKHGFPEGRSGTIELGMRVEEGAMLVVEIRNDGEPLSRKIDATHPETLGLRLVNMLIRDQLLGEFKLIGLETGVLCVIRMPLEVEKHI